MKGRDGLAKDLALRLLPVARQGLIENGVDEQEVAELLAVVEARVQNGQTGAQWQRAAAAKMAGVLPV